MRTFTVAVLLAACMASRAAASFDISSLDKVWLDLEKQPSNVDAAVDGLQNDAAVIYASNYCFILIKSPPSFLCNGKINFLSN